MKLPQHRLLPDHPAYPRGYAKLRAHRLLSLAQTDEARAAATGRVLFHQGAVPQRDSTTVEATAWYRESGSIPGYRNRRWRRHQLELTTAPNERIVGATEESQ